MQLIRLCNPLVRQVFQLFRYRRQVHRFCQYILVWGLLVGLAGNLPAQWPTTVGEDLFIGWGQQSTALAPDSAGGAYVMWPGPDSSEYGTTLLQHVDAWGSRQWTPPISVGGTGDTQIAGDAMVPDDEGGVYVVFADLHYTLPPYQFTKELRLQHITITGEHAFGAGRVVVRMDTTWRGWKFALVPDDSGGVIIAWSDPRRDGLEPTRVVLTLQRYGPDGTAQWDSGGVAVSSVLTNNYPFALIRDGAGGAIVRWSANGTHFQRVSASGTVLWDSTGIQPPEHTAVGKIVPDGAHGAFMYGVRTDSTNPDTNITQYLRIAQRVNEAGEFVWGQSVSLQTFDYIYQHCFLVPTTDHGVLIYIANLPPPGTLHRFGPDGTRFSPPTGWQITQDSLDIPQALLPSWGPTFLAFYTRRVSPNNRDLYARRIDRQGQPVWSDPERPVSEFPAIDHSIQNETGGAILSFFGRGGDLWLKQISVHGNLGEVVTQTQSEADQSLPPAPTLAPNYPNPFNTQTVLTYTLPRRMRVLLQIVDLRGQVLRTLMHQTQPAGHHTLPWDGKNQRGSAVSSGVYFVQMQTPNTTLSRKLIIVR